MNIEEQSVVKIEFYNEAVRYMSNAKETLKKHKIVCNRCKDDILKN